MRLVIAGTLTTVFFCAGILTGQTPAAGPPPVADPVIRVSVNLVQVDTVVTDAHGHSVSDLRAEDFAILEDGRPQKITNFSWNRVAPSGAPPVDATGRPRANPSSGNVHRAIALMVDDSGMWAEYDVIPVIAALRKFVADEVGANDLVSLTASRGGMGIYREFTNDKRQLNAAIDRISQRPGFGQWTVETPSMMKDGVIIPIKLVPGEPRYDHRGDNPPNPVGTLMAAIQSLQNLPGRKAIVLLSHSFAAPQGLTDLANRLGVVIYVIDPHGTDFGVPVIPGNAPYRLLAKQTGGLWIKSAPGSDLRAALAEVLEDMSGYYLLGYQPARSDFELSNGRPVHHAIQVKVLRQGLTARARTGFAGVPEPAVASVPRTREEYLRQALFSPVADRGIRLRLDTAYRAMPAEPPATRRTPVLHTTISVEGRDLKFSEAEDGSRNLVFDLAVAVLNPDGTESAGRDQRYSTAVTPAQAERLTASGLALKLDVKLLTRPGPYQVRAAVRDVSSGAVGNAYSFVEVPDFNQPLSHPGIVLSSIELSPADAAGKPGRNQFVAGTKVHFDCDVFGLNAAPGSGPASGQNGVEMAIRLFHEGAVVFDSEPFPAPPKTLAEHVLTGNVQLGSSLTPGDYDMELMVRDRRAPREKQTASQWVDLAIIDRAQE